MASSSKLTSVNPLVSPMLTDMYQITMAYSYWCHGKQDEPAVYEMFFRKNPFKGEFTVFAGLEEVLAFVCNFKFTAEHLDYLRGQFSREFVADPEKVERFLEWLGKVDCSKVRISSLPEGSVCFPRVPLLSVEGPLAVCQLLETPLLCLINFATLIATNASRFRLAAGPGMTLLEFGARRAQGPDGALSASRYACLGGFDGTSNVLAGHLFGVKVSGTMAHAYVSSFSIDEELPSSLLRSADGTQEVDLMERSFAAVKQLASSSQKTHLGELKAFVAFAISFPRNFLALVDTYDTIASGIPNFLAVASVLVALGYKPKGIRLDSGDLAYLSREGRRLFRECSAKLSIDLSGCLIVASNDINEATLHSLNQQNHEINVFGIGTNLVTCQGQPALGGVYKLVEIKGEPRIKLSEEAEKIPIPGRKNVYRLFGSAGIPLIDVMCRADEPAPVVGSQILCKHPFVEGKRCFICPTKVISLLEPVWAGKVLIPLPSLDEIKLQLSHQLSNMRADHLRPLNPTPYKVAVSSALYDYLHTLWMQEAPIRVLS
ncbi:MAG: nicotinate phosphoribosyltransferase [archaeon]|nr:nicotinate phosphoribosyltransferase [archaeon]